MSLRDDAIYGCDYRDPPDEKCVRWLNNHDDTKVRERPDLVRLPLFNMPGEVVRVEERK
jgi:hypothetical protein